MANAGTALRVGDVVLLKIDGGTGFAVCLPDVQGHKLYFEEGMSHGAPHDVAAATFVIRRPGYYDNFAKLRAVQKSANAADEITIISPGLQAAVKSEAMINSLQTKRDQGLLVHFGDNVMLQHRETGLYFSSDLQGLSWISQPDQSVAFDVSSVFKADTAGEAVLYGQPFALCSVETGRFFGAARRRVDFEDSLDTQLQTAAMSIVASKWADVCSEVSDDTLRGGMVIEIQFFEYEALLAVADGNPCLLLPESIYDTQSLWRIEMAFHDGCPGAAVHPQSVVRLRNLSDYTYLCRETNGKVVLTTDCTHPMAQWQFDMQGGISNLPLRQTKVLLRGHPGREVLTSPLQLRVRELMKFADKNKNNSLDRSEWLAAGGTKEDFALLDLNGDGELDMEELSKTAVSLTGTLDRRMPVAVGSSSVHPSKLCSIRPYDKRQLRLILKSVALTKVASNIVSAMQQKIADSADLDATNAAMKKHSKDIVTCWTNMIFQINETASRNPFTQDGMPKEAEQCVMAQHGAITLTIDLLKLILKADPEQLQYGIARKTIMILFRFLQLLVKGSLSNCASLEKHKEFIYQHINSEYQVVDCVGEMLLDNQQLLKSEVNTEFLLLIRDAMWNQHYRMLNGSRFMSILKTCCSCYGEPHCPNQNQVLVTCIAPLNVKQEKLLSQIQISETGDVQISAPTKNSGKQTYDWRVVRWISISDFQASEKEQQGNLHKFYFDKPLTNCTDDEKVFRFHVQTLQLFIALTRGRNMHTCEFLMENFKYFCIDYRLLLLAITNEALPKFYRGVLVDLMQRIYVDCEPNRSVRMLDPIFMRSTPKSFEVNDHNALPIRGIFDSFPKLRPSGEYSDMKFYVIDVLKQQGAFETLDPDKSEFCGALLSIISLLLMYGKYTHVTNARSGVSTVVYPEGILSNPANRQTMTPAMSDQLHELLDILVCLLNTAGETNFLRNEFTTPIVNAKLRILDMCLSLFDYRLNARMHATFAAYNSCYSETASKGASMTVSNEVFNSLTQDLFSMQFLTKYFHLDKESKVMDDYTGKLLRLTRYDCTDVKVKAFSLLVRHRGQREALVNGLSQACLVMDVNLMYTVQKLEYEANAMRSTIKWLTTATVNCKEAIGNCSRLLSSWISLCTPGATVEGYNQNGPVDPVTASKVKEVLRINRAHESVCHILTLPQQLQELEAMRMQQWITKCERNSDGVVDKDEFRLQCKSLGMILFEGDLQKVLDFEETSVKKMQPMLENAGQADAFYPEQHLINWYKDNFDSYWNSNLNTMLPQCLQMLTCFCQSHTDNQKAVGQLLTARMGWVVNLQASLNVVSTDKTSLAIASNVPLFIASMCQNNDYVCNNFDLGLLDTLCQNAVDAKPSTHQWIDALRCLCSTDGVPLERNCSRIMRNLDDVAYHEFCYNSAKLESPGSLKRTGSNLSNPTKLDRLIQERGNGNNDELHWHAELVFLLAEVVVGTNPPESMVSLVHSLVTLDECIAGICLPVEVDISQLLPQGWEDIIQGLFERYDYDALEVLTNPEDLSQLTLNAVMKLNLKTQEGVLAKQCQEAFENATQDDPWDLDRYTNWLLTTVVTNNTTGTSKGWFKGKGFVSTSAQDSPVNMTTRLKAAYVTLLTQGYLNINNGVTTRSVRESSRIFPRDRALTIFGYPSCVMDELLRGIHMHVSHPGDLDYEKFVFHAVLPALKIYAHHHAAYLSKALVSKLAPLLQSLSDLVKALEAGPLNEDISVKIETVKDVFKTIRSFYNGTIWHTGTKREGDISCGSNPLYISRLDKLCETKQPIELQGNNAEMKIVLSGQVDLGSSGTDLEQRRNYSRLWHGFVSQFTGHLELVLGECDTLLGPCVQDIASMLTHDFTSDNSWDPISSRQVISSMFEVLSSQNKALSWDVFLLVNLLTISKGFLYLYDPYQTNSIGKLESWMRFLRNGPVGKEGQTHVKQWAQWMMAELGAPDVLISLAASSTPLVKLANIQFGIALLEGGNKLVQDAFVTSCNTAQKDHHNGPVALIRSIVIAMSEAKSELSRMLSLPPSTSAEEFQQLTMDRCEEAFSAIAFLEKLAEGYHTGFQQYIGDRRQAGLDIFAQLEDLLVIVVKALRRRAHPTVLTLFDAVLRVCKALTGGPNTKNRVRLLSGDTPIVLGKLLYDCDPLTSTHVPHFVDTYQGNPPGTFGEPPAEVDLRVEEMVKIKLGIYSFMTALLDAAIPETAKSISMHVNPLCLLRDVFKVKANRLSRAPDHYYNPKVKLSGNVGRTTHTPEEEKRIPMSQSAYVLLVSLAKWDSPMGQYNEAHARLKSSANPIWHQYYQAMEPQFSTVEITRTTIEGKLYTYRYYFTTPKICTYLRTFDRIRGDLEERMDCVTRDNEIAKQADFVQCLLDFKITVSHLDFLLELKATNAFIGSITRFLVNWQDVIDEAPLLIGSILIVFLWIVFGGAEDSFGEYTGSAAVAEVLAVTLTISVWLLLLKHMVVIAPQVYQASMQDVKTYSDLSLHQTLHGESAAELLENAKPHEIPLDKTQLQTIVDAEGSRIFDMSTYMAWASRNFSCWYFVLIALFSLTAWVFEHSEDKGIFAFCFLLLDYFRRKEGMLIVESVLVGAPGLLGSAKVAIILIFIYSCVTFWVFEDEMQTSNDCETAFQCIFKTLDAGLHGDIGMANGDDFANIMPSYPLEISQKTKKQAQWLFTISFYVMWGFILEGIVQGYIVDAFSAIRGREDRRIADSKANCYICSLSRFDLQEANIKFDVHVNDHHDRWAYLDMVVRTLMIAKHEQMTTATIVRRALDRSSRHFLPLQRCADMQRDTGKMATVSNEHFQATILDRLTEIESRLNNGKKFDSIPPSSKLNVETNAGTAAEGLNV